jgi:hypothetical protein
MIPPPTPPPPGAGFIEKMKASWHLLNIQPQVRSLKKILYTTLSRKISIYFRILLASFNFRIKVMMLSLLVLSLCS